MRLALIDHGSGIPWNRPRPTSANTAVRLRRSTLGRGRNESVFLPGRSIHRLTHPPLAVPGVQRCLRNAVVAPLNVSRQTRLLRGTPKTSVKKLSQLAKYLLAANAGLLIVSNMTKHDPQLSLLFHALADPTRRSMLARLAEGPAPVSELAGPTGLRLPTVMRHLTVLEEAGLIKTTKDGRTRTCAIIPEALAPARSWLDEQHSIWEARLDRLDNYVTKLMKERNE